MREIRNTLDFNCSYVEFCCLWKNDGNNFGGLELESVLNSEIIRAISRTANFLACFRTYFVSLATLMKLNIVNRM